MWVKTQKCTKKKEMVTLNFQMNKEEEKVNQMLEEEEIKAILLDI